MRMVENVAMGESRIWSRVYYGWWIVAGLFIVLTMSSGFGFYNMSVYMNVLAERRGFAIADMSFAISLFFVVGGIGGMLVARLLERFDARWVMIVGALIGGMALGYVGQATSLLMVYLLFSLFGFGNAAVSIITATTLVTRWFPGRNRSIALSVASTGLSAGGILLTPLSARLLSGYGPESTIPWFGLLFVLGIVPIALLLVRNGPVARSADGGTAFPPDPVDWSYEDAIRSRFFVLLTVGYLFAMGAQVGGIAHLYNRAERLAGFETAAMAVQALTIFSISGRFLGGWLVTRVPIRWYTLGNLLGQAIGLSLIAAAPSGPWILLGAAVFGGTVGNLLMLHPLWLVDGFGVRAYARIFSLSNALTVIGVAGGPAILGVVFDRAGYSAAYLAAVLASCVALVALSAAGAAPARPLVAN